MEVKEKLKHLLPHWVEHNEAHAESYSQWAKKAREGGLAEVASEIEEAVEVVNRANDALKKALGALG